MYREINPTLIKEELRALKWFLTLFYLIYFSYEIFYHAIYKNIDLELPQNINLWMYALLISFLPISFILIRKGKLFIVKYFFVTSYIMISVIKDRKSVV